MRNVKIIIFICCFILTISTIFISGFFIGRRSTSESLKQTLTDLQLAKDSTTTAELQLDATAEIVKGLRGELTEERKNYDRLEQSHSKLEEYNRELKAEHIKQREIYRKFGITNRSSQEAVETISRLVEESRVIVEGLLEECERGKD